jgi:hypothetical protein
MIGDKETEDNTLWYDNLLNDLYQKDESPKLATSQQKRSEEETQTSSHEAV